MKRLIFGLWSIVVLSALGASQAYAAPKKIRPPEEIALSPSETYQTSIKLTETVKDKRGRKKKKTSRHQIHCFETTPGQARVSGGGLLFTSLAEKLRYAKAVHKRKRTAKNARSQDLYTKLLKAGKKACLNLPFRSLDLYRGSFGREQAQTLCNRFLIACSPAEIDQAVADGLDAFVSRVSNYVSEPALDAEQQELRCDGRFADNPANETCDALNPNDLYAPGVRYDIYNRLLKSRNRFFERIFLFLSDDRGAINSNALSSCELHALPAYVDTVREASISGSAKEYCREIVKDHLSGIRYLHLDGSDKYGPNEDQARELMELQCMSPTDLDGNPVYADQTVAQMALALTGWLIEGRSEYPAGGDGDGYYVCRAGYFEGRHADGGKQLFSEISGAAPITVHDYRDTPDALFSHPHTAEAWARDIWLEFINPNPSKAALQELAQIIRESDFNLVPVFKRIMKSKAVFAAESKGALFKYPLEIVIGLALQTGIPLTSPDENRNFASLDNLLDRLGQRPLRAPSIFGWYPDLLAGEFRVLDRRNVTVELFNDDLDDLLALGFSFRSSFMSGLQGQSDPAASLVERVSSALGLVLNASQRSTLDTFMNWRLESCWNGRPGCVSGQQYLQVRDVFDPHPNSEERYEERVRDLIIMLAETPEYYVK